VCRDTTYRDRQLVTKDATIREIHHRVKNNLQTVAALLRLQARRITSPEGAAALQDAMGRVQAIAVVHEILSQSFAGTVAFDDIVDRLLRHVGEASASRGKVRTLRVGTFGDVPAAAATSLSLVITELCQNAVEHGFAYGPGTVTLTPRRERGRLVIEVADDGAGLPEGFDTADTDRTSLGLSIVTTLVKDLHGTFALQRNPAGGATGGGDPGLTGMRPRGVSDRGVGPANAWLDACRPLERMRDRATRRLRRGARPRRTPDAVVLTCRAHCRHCADVVARAPFHFFDLQQAGCVPRSGRSSGSSVRQAA
jgi:two-component sensor histidine kinase